MGGDKMIAYQKLECDYYSILTHFEYPMKNLERHCFKDFDFLSQAKELYENASDEKVRELAFNLSLLVSEGELLTDKQIGLFKNSYKRHKKGEILNGI
jgi:hypothetical protein